MLVYRNLHLVEHGGACHPFSFYFSHGYTESLSFAEPRFSPPQWKKTSQQMCAPSACTSRDKRFAQQFQCQTITAKTKNPPTRALCLVLLHLVPITTLQHLRTSHKARVPSLTLTTSILLSSAASPVWDFVHALRTAWCVVPRLRRFRTLNLMLTTSKNLEPLAAFIRLKKAAQNQLSFL